MENLMLQANKRDVFGKKTRFLRRQGITPTHLFGHGLGSLSLQCDTAKLHRIIAQAGTTRVPTTCFSYHVDDVAPQPFGYRLHFHYRSW